LILLATAARSPRFDSRPLPPKPAILAGNPDLPSAKEVVARLRSTPAQPDLAALKPNAEHADFEKLAQAVRDAIENEKPELGLDRLHSLAVPASMRAMLAPHKTLTLRHRPLQPPAGSGGLSIFKHDHRNLPRGQFFILAIVDVEREQRIPVALAFAAL
jgi:hypothetical protein